MAVLKRRKDGEETKAKTSQNQQTEAVEVTPVNETPATPVTNTTPDVEEEDTSQYEIRTPRGTTHQPSGSGDYGEDDEDSAADTGTSTKQPIQTETANEIKPVNTTTPGSTGTGSMYDRMREWNYGQGQNEGETPTSPKTTVSEGESPASETEGETPETQGETEPPATPANNGMPQRGTRFEDEARANAPKEHTPEELEDAKKRGRRESRMATAGHIMDTLARVLNFAATTKGAPSAKWSNRNREFDKNTYYDRMKKENEEARKNYFNMMLAGAGQDTKEYQSALEGWKAGRNDARDQAKADREAQLFPGQLEAQRLTNEGMGLKNDAQRIANENAPKEQELKNKLLQAQIDHTKAGTAKTYEEIRKSKASGSGSGSSTSDMWLPKLGDNGEPVIIDGQPQYVQYDNMNDYLAARAYLADKYNIDSRKRKDEYQWGMKTKEELGADQISNMDFAKIVGDSIMSKNGVPSLAR